MSLRSAYCRIYLSVGSSLLLTPSLAQGWVTSSIQRPSTAGLMNTRPVNSTLSRPGCATWLSAPLERVPAGLPARGDKGPSGSLGGEGRGLLQGTNRAVGSGVDLQAVGEGFAKSQTDEELDAVEWVAALFFFFLSVLCAFGGCRK
jgi:hypothetical protein